MRKSVIIREHILKGDPNDFGVHCIDIYLVAYVSEKYGRGKEKFFEHIKSKGISEKANSAQAIWQVGKGDGQFLGILNNDGSVKDWSFMANWIGIISKKAVIDRFEGDYAVVLVGDEEVKLDVPRALLPQGGREGSWLKMSFELDPEGTRSQEEKIAGLLDKLKNKNS